ncbi:hypothetical protein KUV50_02065 [Membranicola marinus]|uniref:Tryptophan-rich sensory protein n=1 Tax=Membranihabitans marinus TaxID=1227546 RepID=A0A953HJK3_9BACT|nr:hypothetical protein [Membranihabitans marinus]MBY5956902.1 hypothetical protein [Membranihabitans marinus]
MKKTLQIANSIAFVLMLIVNYLSNTGFFNHQTIAEVSRQNQSLITPAGYTFAIWGVIYLLLAGFVIYQSRSLIYPNAKDDFVLKVGGWFVLSCLANIGWIVTWLYGYTLISVIVMLILLYSLIQIIIHNQMELYDAPLSVIAFLWWPFVVYTGWITVATIVNIAAYLVKINWGGWGVQPEVWTIIMILAAVLINTMAIRTRNLREFATVGVWSLIGIAVANWGTNLSIQYTAIGSAIVLFILISLQAYRNFDTNPVTKLWNGEIR